MEQTKLNSIIKKKLFVQTQLGLKYELKLDVDDEIKSINRKPKTDLPLCKESAAVVDIVVKTKMGDTLTMNVGESDSILTLKVEETLKLTILTIYGEYKITAASSTPVYMMKKFIRNKCGIPSGRTLVLCLCGMTMSDYSLLDDYDISDGDVIELHQHQLGS